MGGEKFSGGDTLEYREKRANGGRRSKPQVQNPNPIQFLRFKFQTQNLLVRVCTFFELEVLKTSLGFGAWDLGFQRIIYSRTWILERATFER